ncbi:hypothetical protein EI555_019255, partial [Monodon monoceros]
LSYSCTRFPDKDPSSSCTLKRILEGTVQLRLSSSLGPNIQEIEWNWDSGDDEKPQLLVSWRPNTPNPDWYDLEEKQKHRFNVTEMAFLSIRNLTLEMSGLYTAKIKFHSGKSQEEVFRLCLYERIPHPRIQIHSSSNTSGCCNVSLEELERSRTLGPAPSSRKLSLSLPLGYFNSRLTCVVSSPADEKKAALHLEDICPWREQMALERHPSCGSDGEPSSWSVDLDEKEDADWERQVLGGSTLLPVGPGSATTPQALLTVESANLQTGVASSHDPPYEEISFLRHPKKDREKGSYHSHSPECTLAIHTVYEKIRRSPEPQGDA